MLWKCFIQQASKFGKLNSGHRIWEGQFSLHSQRKAMPKNVQTTAQLHSSHMLANNAQNSPSQASTVCEPWTSRCQAVFRKGRGTRDQIANICWIIEKVREFQKSIYFSFIDYAKAFVWITATYLLQGHNLMYNIDSQRYEPLFNIY